MKLQKYALMHNLKVILFTLVAIATISKILIFISEERNLYIPDKNITLTPRSIQINYEDIYFKTKDGESLSGWFVPAGNAKITILYCGGRSGNLTDKLQEIKFFHEAGFNIFAFDYRGFGNSSGRPSEQGLYKDARAAYDYLMTRNDIEKDKIVAYGQSLGGPVAADLCLHRKLAALILEDSFPSLKAYVGDIGGFLPTEWLVSEKFDAVSRVIRIHIPKLFVHGMDDEVIMFSEGRMLFNKALPPKEFFPFDGGHEDNLFTISDAYKDRINKFFSDYHILQ
jgi:fermentation-respiration switch protein FrsA (DUF1100 family)